MSYWEENLITSLGWLGVPLNELEGGVWGEGGLLCFSTTLIQTWISGSGRYDCDIILRSAAHHARCVDQFNQIDKCLNFKFFSYISILS